MLQIPENLSTLPKPAGSRAPPPVRDAATAASLTSAAVAASGAASNGPSRVSSFAIPRGISTVIGTAAVGEGIEEEEDNSPEHTLWKVLGKKGMAVIKHGANHILAYLHTCFWPRLLTLALCWTLFSPLFLFTRSPRRTKTTHSSLCAGRFAAILGRQKQLQERVPGRGAVHPPRLRHRPTHPGTFDPRPGASSTSSDQRHRGARECPTRRTSSTSSSSGGQEQTHQVPGEKPYLVWYGDLAAQLQIRRLGIVLFAHFTHEVRRKELFFVVYLLLFSTRESLCSYQSLFLLSFVLCLLLYNRTFDIQCKTKEEFDSLLSALRAVCPSA